MSVQLLLKGKGNFVPVIRSTLTLKDVIDQLDVDSAGALVVTDDGQNILGDIARGLKTFGRDVVDRPLREIMTKDVISCDANQTLVDLVKYRLA